MGLQRLSETKRAIGRLLVTLKSSNACVLCLWPMFSFLLLIIIFKLQNYWFSWWTKCVRIKNFNWSQILFSAIIQTSVEKSRTLLIFSWPTKIRCQCSALLEPLTIRQSWLVTQRCSWCVYVHVCVHLDGLNTEHKFWVWDTIHGHADLMTWTRFTSTATTCQCYGCHHIKINNNTSMKTNKETDIISYSHDLNTACKCEQYSLGVTPVRRHACQSQILTVCCQKNKNKFRKKYYQFWIAKIYMLLQYCSGK